MHEPDDACSDGKQGVGGWLRDNRQDASVLIKDKPLAIGSAGRGPVRYPCVDTVTACADGTEREPRVRTAAAGHRETGKIP